LPFPRLIPSPLPPPLSTSFLPSFCVPSAIVGWKRCINPIHLPFNLFGPAFPIPLLPFLLLPLLGASQKMHRTLAGTPPSLVSLVTLLPTTLLYPPFDRLESMSLKNPKSVFLPSPHWRQFPRIFSFVDCRSPRQLSRERRALLPIRGVVDICSVLRSLVFGPFLI